MKLLVCGDRNWTDRQLLFHMLDGLHETYEITQIIEGSARGADIMGLAWAVAHKIPFRDFPAKWDLYGRAAGPIRNQQMLDEGQPDAVIAFHDHIEQSKGTKDMLARAKRAGLPHYLVTSDKMEGLKVPNLLPI